MREQHDHRVRFQRRADLNARLGKVLVDDAAVLHVGREQAERQPADLGPGDLLAVREFVAGGGDQLVALGIERHAGDASKRLVVEIGDAGIDVEIAEQGQHLNRCA